MSTKFEPGLVLDLPALKRIVPALAELEEPVVIDKAPVSALALPVEILTAPESALLREVDAAAVTREISPVLPPPVD
jgi:hypothetical protein